jgi:Flp pilus assembly pilin Flp
VMLSLITVGLVTIISSIGTNISGTFSTVSSSLGQGS